MYEIGRVDVFRKIRCMVFVVAFGPQINSLL